jgi:hypothetical protein
MSQVLQASALGDLWKTQLLLDVTGVASGIRSLILVLFIIDPNPIMILSKVCSSPPVHCDCTWHFHFFSLFDLSGHLLR